MVCTPQYMLMGLLLHKNPLLATSAPFLELPILVNPVRVLIDFSMVPLTTSVSTIAPSPPAKYGICMPLPPGRWDIGILMKEAAHPPHQTPPTHPGPPGNLVRH